MASRSLAATALRSSTRTATYAAYCRRANDPRAAACAATKYFSSASDRAASSASRAGCRKKTLVFPRAKDRGGSRPCASKASTNRFASVAPRSLRTHP